MNYGVFSNQKYKNEYIFFFKFMSETNKRKLLYFPSDNKVAKYTSDPKGTIVATIKQTVKREI